MKEGQLAAGCQSMNMVDIYPVQDVRILSSKLEGLGCRLVYSFGACMR